MAKHLLPGFEPVPDNNIKDPRLKPYKKQRILALRPKIKQYDGYGHESQKDSKSNVLLCGIVGFLLGALVGLLAFELYKQRQTLEHSATTNEL